MRISPLILAGLLLPLVAQSQEIYRWVDKDGVVHYADQPGAPDAQRVPYRAFGTSSTDDAAQSPDQSPADTPPSPPVGPTYQSLSIVSPTPDQVFFGGGVTVPVQLQLDRDLRPGDSVAYFVDGTRQADGNGLSTTLTGLDRGRHFVRAAVLDDAGSVVISSQPVTFYVRQPSVVKPPTGPDVTIPRPKRPEPRPQ